MQIVHDWINFSAPYEECVLTLGNFDGLHVGHRKLIHILKQRAAALALPSCVIAYQPPLKTKFPLLYTLKEKEEIFYSSGIDYLFSISLSEELKSMSAPEYLEKILCQKLKASHIMIGYDHRFGKNRQGDYKFLKKNAPGYGFEASQVSAEMHNDEPVSSTMVREYLEKGDIKTANWLLRTPFPMEGTVVQGNQIGTQLGFKTANLKFAPEKLIPAHGVYYARARIFLSGRHEEFVTVVNIGTRPTFALQECSVEAHLLGFEGDLYGKTLRMELLERIRDEKKFESREQLTAQIQEDVTLAQQLAEI